MSTKTVTGVSYNPFNTVSYSQDGNSGSYSLGTRTTLTPTSTPKATKTITYSGQALSSGTYTLDLTAAPDGGTLTGLYLRSITIENPVANAAAIRLDVGGSNGLSFGAASTDDISIPSGGSLEIRHASAGEVIDSTHKNITVTSSNTTAIFNVTVVAGTN